MTPVYALFHLNLAYSSIDEGQRAKVIDCCYWPLLDLVRKNQWPLGIELTGWTLAQIQQISPDWVDVFAGLIKKKQCELIGSGYTQMIGPLVPYEVNLWNQALGLEQYQAILGVKPRLALVNEMAYSSAMIDIYHEAGYKGIVMDRDNVSLALGITTDDEPMPSIAAGNSDASLPVLWSDSILFQKLQRYVHGDIGMDDYLEYFQRRQGGKAALALYANDAEIFDHRPGRFETESALHAQGEWNRLAGLFKQIHDEGAKWVTPSQALAINCRDRTNTAASLTSIGQPVPVKKQAKYNISRWAVTGRNDLWINTMCHRVYKKLSDSARSIDDSLKMQMCDLWASDLRTHITETRWQGAVESLTSLASTLGVSLEYGGEDSIPRSLFLALTDAGLPNSEVEVQYSSDNISLTVHTDQVELVLNLRRGLAITSLAFKSHEFKPTIATLPQGYFHSIELGADFYSGGVVVELINEHRRVTDLEWVKPNFSYENGTLSIQAIIDTSLGRIIKTISVKGEHVSLSYSFPDWQRPFGTVRVGMLTLAPDTFSGALQLAIPDGSGSNEIFQVSGEVNHARPASTLVSASTGLSAPAGQIVFGDENHALKVHWDPAQCAAFPMLMHSPSSPSFFARMVLSLAEADETFKAGGVLPDFTLTVEPN